MMFNEISSDNLNQGDPEELILKKKYDILFYRMFIALSRMLKTLINLVFDRFSQV